MDDDRPCYILKLVSLILRFVLSCKLSSKAEVSYLKCITEKITAIWLTYERRGDGMQVFQRNLLVKMLNIYQISIVQ